MKLNMTNAFLKLALMAASAASAVNTYSADTPAAATANATPVAGDFPKTGLQLWLCASQVEQADGAITVIKDLSGNENHAQRDPPSASPVSNPALAKDGGRRPAGPAFPRPQLPFCLQATHEYPHCLRVRVKRPSRLRQ